MHKYKNPHKMLYPAQATLGGSLSNVEVMPNSLVNTGKIPPIIISPCLNTVGMLKLPNSSQPKTVLK